MVWARISMHRKTDLHIIKNGTLTAVCYAIEIPDVYVRLYAGAIVPDFTFMVDRASPHRAHVTNQYLEDASLA